MVRSMDLKKAAKQAGIHGIDIAMRFCVSNSTVSRWLNREVAVPSENVRDFAALLKIDPLDVLPPARADAIATESVQK